MAETKNTEILKRKGLEPLIREFDNVRLDIKQFLRGELNDYDVDAVTVNFLAKTIENNEKHKRKMHAITPIDGRYDRYVEELHDITSEFAWTKKRVFIEVEYLIALTEELHEKYTGEKRKITSRKFTDKEKQRLRDLYKNFNEDDFRKFKLLDKEIGHDVVAMTTWMVYELGDSMGDLKNEVEAAIHFCLTSDDIDGNVYNLIVQELFNKQYIPTIVKLQETLLDKVETWKDYVFAGQTHGQYAEYTKLKTVFSKFAYAINQVMNNFIQDGEQIILPGKLGGAIGNCNDIVAVYPDSCWLKFNWKFVEDILGLKYEPITDQPEFGIKNQEVYHNIINANNVLIKICSDFWSYCSRGLFKKQTKEGESGSSVMAQKSNPWNSEGAEALFNLANSGFYDMADQIKNRMQGDLRRSIPRRNIGEPFAKTIIGIKRLIKELNNYEPNYENIKWEAEKHSEMSAAAVQTILRREGISDAYDTLKEMTMGRTVYKSDYMQLAADLCLNGNITREVRDEISSIVFPDTNVGYARESTQYIINQVKKTLKKVKKAYEVK